MKTPKTVSEHVIALYHQVAGVKKDLTQLRTNDLRHIHKDIEGLHSKSDRIVMYIIGGLASTISIIVGVLFKLL
tara:strand:+ start:194 stop:415 length:222 start_codon:yes stop_codon:yes gene_type:complete